MKSISHLYLKVVTQCLACIRGRANCLPPYQMSNHTPSFYNLPLSRFHGTGHTKQQTMTSSREAVTHKHSRKASSCGGLFESNYDINVPNKFMTGRKAKVLVLFLPALDRYPRDQLHFWMIFSRLAITETQARQKQVNWWDLCFTFSHADIYACDRGSKTWIISAISTVKSKTIQHGKIKYPLCSWHCAGANTKWHQCLNHTAGLICKAIVTVHPTFSSRRRAEMSWLEQLQAQSKIM